MIKNIFEEVNPPDFSFYFDDDYMADNLYIISRGRMGINTDKYEKIIEQAQYLVELFNDAEDGIVYENGETMTHEGAMEEAGIDSSVPLEKLLAWYKLDGNTSDPADIADFLTITTGEIWRTMTVCGYCQGDWCDIVYKTTDADSDQFARISGELYLGRGKEFALLDDDGFGGCSGYFVADCQIRNDEDYKKVLCDMAGCSIEETAVRLISDIRTETHYDYKTI